MSRPVRIIAIITLLLSALASTATDAASYVYVSLDGENKISIFALDETSGELKHLSDIAFVRCHVKHGLAVKQYIALGRSQQAGNNIEQG